MTKLDWAVVVAYAALTGAFALWFARKRRRQTGEDYMVAGRRLPWWIVGIADTATSDGADAVWVFAFFSGAFMAYYRIFWVESILVLPLAIVWARYWRRLGVATPAQFYEERYGGRGAARFRAFSSIWVAAVPGAIVLAYVFKGFAQIMEPFLGLRADAVLLVFCGATLAYAFLSGFLAVAYSDLVQFSVMMVGRIVLCFLVLKAAGGLGSVLDRVEDLRGHSFLQPYPPATGARWGKFQLDSLSLAALLVVGLFKIADPGNAIVQKSLAAKDERHAAGGRILSAVLSLVVRLVPMTIVALVAIVTFPDAESDTDLWADLVRRTAGPGLVGLLLVGIIAGYMDTLAGLANFAASGVLNDVYRRFIAPEADDRRQIRFGRFATAGVVAIAWAWARFGIGRIDAAWLNFINSVTALFTLPLMMLRWTWWRLNLWGEVVGFVGAMPLAWVIWFGVGDVIPAFHERPYWQSFAILFGTGWTAILAATLFTRPESMDVLERFYRKVRPPGFWGPVARSVELDPAVRSAWRAELRADLGTALAGVVFSAALVVGMGAAFARRWGLFGTTAAAAVASGWAFWRLYRAGERVRAGLTTGS